VKEKTDQRCVLVDMGVLPRLPSPLLSSCKVRVSRQPPRSVTEDSLGRGHTVSGTAHSGVKEPHSDGHCWLLSSLQVGEAAPGLHCGSTVLCPVLLSPLPFMGVDSW
jgi:hypothetical protein